MDGDTVAVLMAKVQAVVRLNADIARKCRSAKDELRTLTYRTVHVRPGQFNLIEEQVDEQPASIIGSWKWCGSLKPIEPVFVSPVIDYTKSCFTLDELEALNEDLIKLANRYAAFGESVKGVVELRDVLHNCELVQTALGQLHARLLPGESQYDQLDKLVKEANRILAELAQKGVVLSEGQVGRQGSAEGEFNGPRGLAVDRRANRVFVADSSNSRVQVFDAQLRLSRTIVTESVQPWGIALSPKGNLYVTVPNRDKVQVYDADSGAFIREWGVRGTAPANLCSPQGIAVDQSSGNVLIADFSNCCVKVFDEQGAFIRSIGSKGHKIGQFSGPTGVAVSERHGHIVVTDCNSNRVLVFTLEGDFVRSFGSNGSKPGEFGSPRDAAVDADGNIAVTDWNNNRVQIFDHTGSLLRIIPVQGQPFGVAMDGSTGLLVSNVSTNCVNSFCY